MTKSPVEALTVEAAGPAQAGIVAALHRRALGQIWPEDDIARLLTGPGGHGWLAYCAGHPAGHLLVRRAADEAEILTLGCRPAARRRGVARALLAQAQSALAKLGTRRLYLEVAVDNAAALALYKAAGFASVGRRRGYYSRDVSSVDALVLAARLCDSRGN